MADYKMTRKGKIQYIWDYYKIQIIVTIMVLIGLVSFIHGQITKINYEFNLTIIGSSVDGDSIEKLKKTLTPIVIKNPTKKQSALVDIMSSGSLTGGNDDASAQYLQKFIAELSANVIDLLILNKSDYDVFQKQGAFLRLDKLKGIDLSGIKIEELQGTTAKGFYGINLQDNKLLEKFRVNTENMILCIPASTKQGTKAVLAIKWILENK
ncbi:MAG TPA: hypothetical protein VIK72_07610 [Clostridiaceae bacterium]